MTRSAEELLEFGRLRELLRRQTTSALGGRAVDALSFGTDGARLEREFATIAEAVAWLRQGSEMGFGGLADPAGWFARLDKPGAVLEPTELLEVASLADTAGWLREAFRETQAKFPLLTERARSAGSPATNSLAAAIRRAIEPGGEIRDDASPELRRLRTGIGRTRENIQSTLRRHSAGARRAAGRGLRHAAQRPLRDSGAGFGAARRAGRGACRQRHRADRFSRTARNHRAE